MLRRTLSGLLSAVVVLALALLALEAGLRLGGIGDDAIFHPHPWVGWVHIPSLHASLVSEDRGLGRRMPITIDSLGLRDIERRTDKPPGVYRVLLLGDSFVEAAQVPLDSTFARRLERALAQRTGRAVEVWNTGVAGYSTAQELLYLEHVANRFYPDLVVQCFFAGNDVNDEIPAIATSLRNRPFFRLERERLVLDRSYLRPDRGVVAWLRLHSRLFTWASTQRRIAQENLRARSAGTHGAGGLPPGFSLYAERPDSLWAHAWELCERLIVATREEATRQGADFVLVSISTGTQETAAARARQQGWDQWGRFPGLSLERPDERLRRLCAANAIDFVPMLPVFRAEQERSGKPLHIGWTGHWNSAGHRLATRVLVERLAGYVERARR